MIIYSYFSSPLPLPCPCKFPSSAAPAPTYNIPQSCPTNNLSILIPILKSTLALLLPVIYTNQFPTHNLPYSCSRLSLPNINSKTVPTNNLCFPLACPYQKFTLALLLPIIYPSPFPTSNWHCHCMYSAPTKQSTLALVLPILSCPQQSCTQPIFLPNFYPSSAIANILPQSTSYK